MGFTIPVQYASNPQRYPSPTGQADGVERPHTYGKQYSADARGLQMPGNHRMHRGSRQRFREQIALPQRTLVFL